MNTGAKMDVLLWGGKSKARIVYQRLMERSDVATITIFEHTQPHVDFDFEGRHIGDMAQLRSSLSDLTHFVICIGGEHGYARVKTAEAFVKQGLEPVEIISRHCYIDETSSLGVGNHVMPSSAIHCFCRIGDYCIVNTSASIDHDCHLGNGVHVMGAAAVAGNVKIGDYATIGTNATVLPNLTIGEGAFVGAGAVVTKDVADHTVVVGSPARDAGKNEFRCSQELLDQLNA